MVERVEADRLTIILKMKIAHNVDDQKQVAVVVVLTAEITIKNDESDSERLLIRGKNVLQIEWCR